MALSIEWLIRRAMDSSGVALASFIDVSSVFRTHTYALSTYFLLALGFFRSVFTIDIKTLQADRRMVGLQLPSA